MRKYINATTAIVSILTIAVVAILSVFYTNVAGGTPALTNVLTKTIASTTATTTPVKRNVTVSDNIQNTVTDVRGSLFSIDPRDGVISWKLSNTPSETIIKKYKQKISSLTTELHKGKYSDYDIYVQLGQDYEILNNGKQAYKNYNMAGALNSEKGVAMSDIGALMEHVGALHTAHNAYAQSVTRQPSVSLFWVLYLKFLALHEARATTTPVVFASARKVTNNNTSVLITEAQWLSSIGRIKDAVSDWKTIRENVPAQQQGVIDERIVQLEAGAH